MTEAQELEEFNKNHPHPDAAGIESLFKFYRFNVDHIEHLRNLFVDGKLYHSFPEYFNDPFECKPHFNWPNNPSKVQAIRKHLINVAMRNGHTRKSAKTLISKNMSRPEFIQETIYYSIQKTFCEVRICSFTSKKGNLLLWSHYADSHKGFCVEYDATKLPISYAFKVQYKDECPEAIYPSPANALGFIPVLIKSKTWEYEEEYRIIFVPEATNQPRNNSISLILNGNEIKNVYLGVNMDDANKQDLIELIDIGPFHPGIWDAFLSKSSFKLEFNER